MENRVRIEYKTIIVSTISDENIDKCVEVRECQGDFFFGGKPDKEESKNWILEHRTTLDDVLFQIIHRGTGEFLGTMGMVRRGEDIEVGRLALDAKGIYHLLKQGVAKEEIGEVGLNACLCVLRLIEKVATFRYAYAEVLANNALSNRLCLGEAGKVEESYKVSKTGEKIKTFLYKMDKDYIRKRYGNEEMVILLA